jgi:LPXTG-motif cell wall-anchored protein
MMKRFAFLVMALVVMALGAVPTASASTIAPTPLPEVSSSDPTDDPTDVPENGTPCAASVTEGESPTEGVWLDGQCVVSDSYPEPTPTPSKASAKPKPTSQPDELAKTGVTSTSVFTLVAGTIATALGIYMLVIAARRPTE